MGLSAISLSGDELDERVARAVRSCQPEWTNGHQAVVGDFVCVDFAAVVSGDVVIGEGTLVGAKATILLNLCKGVTP